MNFAGFAKGEPIMGIPVVGRCRSSEFGLWDIIESPTPTGRNQLRGTPVHAYQTEKTTKTKVVLSILHFQMFLNGLLNLILLCAASLMRPCRPRDRPGQTCGGSPVTDLKHVCNTGTRSVRLSHQHIQHAG